jgi:uncharacterized repeat protein (TIGR01451 family)
MRRQIINLAKFLFVVFVVFGLCVASHPPPTMAEPPTPTPPPRPRYEGLEELPYRAPTALQTAPQENATSSRFVAWSKLVFQSYRDGNWEIYLANGDGSNQTRLTYDGAADIHPRLNRGCTHVAFASNRTGNYEIFTMKADGSGLTQLTANGTDDGNPSWSPDGTRIAFEAYRDGQAEIYVMNANGSGQTRLTWDSAYDGEPAWSPDGARIAFTSRRTGGYRIWVMNADGSGQRLLSTQPYSEHAAWSPDGTQIVYDTDADGDGWQELWLMNADGSGHPRLYDPNEYQTDAWARSWSPDGRYVAFTRISFVYYEGSWYWTTAYLDALDSVTPSWNTVRLSSQGTDWHPDWQTSDSSPPSTAVRRLPAYLRNGDMVSWGGSDFGGSGIKTYDVQYRDASTTGTDGQVGLQGAWTDWQMETVAILATLNGVSGHTYYFRSRATDNAQNVENWPSGDGDTYTTLYTWGVAGAMQDNAGTPVVGAMVTTTPGAFYSVSSDVNGAYATYVVADSSTYTITWAKSGYGDLPAAGFAAAQDAHVNVVLPPNDNVVQNWGFESGNLGPGDWLASGIVTPVATSNVKHTGSYAALLGQQEFAFAPATNVPSSTGDQSNPQLAVDRSGAVHVVWEDSTPGKSDIFYAKRSSDGAWSGFQNISSTSGGAANPQLAVDASGTVHVVWEDSTPGYLDIFYAKRSSDGTWSGLRNISANSGWSANPQLAVDRSGAVHVVWQDSTPGNTDIFYAKRSSDGAWSGSQNISSTSGGAANPQLAVDAGGTVHAVWSGYASGNHGIFYVGPATVGQTCDFSITQAITVPITMSTPTLSFLYQLKGASPTSGSWFNVQVDNGITATTLFSTTASADDWTHHWFDLTTWAGQAITLTFNLHQTAGDPIRWVYLDEVTLGSAYPDLWVSKGGSITARPGEQAVYTISYGNRGGAAASGVRITDTLPAELTFVTANLLPITATPSLVWDGGDLSAKSGSFTIVVTATVAPTVPLASTLTNTVAIEAISPELETFNNTTQAVTFIGYRIYLPMIIKAYLE